MNKKLSKKAIICYSFGDIGCCLMNYMISYYLSFYCSVFLGISLAAVGTMLLLVQVWDAANDIVVGNLIDYTRTKEGMARPWIKWFMIPCCLSGMLIYACPISLPTAVKTAWVFIAYFLFVLFYTCVNLPYGSLLSLMTKDSVERSTLSTSRYIGAYLGLLCVSVGALPLVKLIGGDDGRAEGYRMVMILYCLAALILFFFLHKNCKEIDCGNNFPAPKGTEQKREKMSLSAFGENLKTLFKNKAWVLVLIVSVIYWVRYPFYGSTMTYYYRFYLGIDETASSVMYTVGTVAGIIVLPFVSKLIGKFDYKKTLIGSCVVSAVAMLLGFLCQKNVNLAIVFFTVDYASEVFPCAITLSMIADSLEYGELKFGKKITGLGYAANSFCTKAGPALGGFMVTMALSASKLDTSAELGAAQPASAIWAIRIIFWLVPAVLSLAMCIFTQKYPLDKKTYAKVMEELQEKQEAEH